MKKYFFILFICIGFFACTGRKTPPNPKNLLNKQEMSKILFDIYSLEASLNADMPQLSDEEKAKIVYKNYDSLFAKYNINREDFDANIAYYAQHTDDFIKVFETTMKELQKQKETLDSIPITK